MRDRQWKRGRGVYVVVNRDAGFAVAHTVRLSSRHVVHEGVENAVDHCCHIGRLVAVGTGQFLHPRRIHTCPTCPCDRRLPDSNHSGSTRGIASAWVAGPGRSQVRSGHRPIRFEYRGAPLTGRDGRNSSLATTKMKIRVGFEMEYQCRAPTPMVLALSIHYSRASDLVRPDLLVTSPAVTVTAYRDLFGNWCSRLVAPPGRFVLSTDAVVNDSGLPDVVATEAKQSSGRVSAGEHAGVSAR